jgi:hypothetical protein
VQNWTPLRFVSKLGNFNWYAKEIQRILSGKMNLLIKIFCAFAVRDE